MSLSAIRTRKLLLKIGFIILGITILVAGTLAIALKVEFQKLESDDPTVWEMVIREFEEEDQEQPPRNHAVLFLGSSSIRFWPDLEQDMHPLPVIRRGFGGAKIRDIIHYANRIIFPYAPKAIVLFAGTNDISGRANDKSPEAVLGDFVTLTRLVHQKLPAPFIYLPMN